MEGGVEGYSEKAREREAREESSPKMVWMDKKGNGGRDGGLQ